MATTLPGIPGFSLFVPLQLEPVRDGFWDDYLANAKRLGVERVFLCGISSPADPQALADAIRERVLFFAANGIKAGCWYGPTLGWSPVQSDEPCAYTEIVGYEGRVSHGIACPLDEDFRRDLAEGIAAVAASGVDMILLEDDFRLHLHASPFGCFCPLHMERFARETGCTLPREQLVQQVLAGEPNDLRRLWVRTAGRALVELAQRIEQRVHAENPDTRLGFATVMSQYCDEGFDIEELITALSGKTKPFARTIGAPYWSNDAHHAAWITEYTRLQRHWLRRLDIDLMAEGDTYPHSSWLSHASGLIAFSQGLIASGFPGMLLYGQSYTLPVGHDTAYVDRFARDLPHFRLLRKLFPENSADVGVVPVETKNNFENLTLPDPIDLRPGLHWPDEPAAVHFLSRMGVPIAYDHPTAPVVLFGYGARGFSDEQITMLLSRGAVLDAPAARWLMQRGFDVGLESCEPAETLPAYELFEDQDAYRQYAGDLAMLCCNDRRAYYRAVPKAGAKVLSHYAKGLNEPLYPSALLYEGGGARLCVLPVDTSVLFDAAHVQTLYSYQRQCQLQYSLAWAGRKPLEVCVSGVPNLHVIARRTPDGALAVLLQNAWNDPVENPMLTLPASQPVHGPIAMLGHEAQRIVQTRQYSYHTDELFGYLTLRATIPPLGAVAVLLQQGEE